MLSPKGSNANDYDKALNYSRRALLEYQTIKTTVKNVSDIIENETQELTGLSKKDWIYFSIAIPIASGKISTKPFKNFKTELLGGNLRPEIEYQFTSDEKFNSMVVWTYTY